MAPLASVLESADTRRKAFAALKAGLSGAGGPAPVARVEPTLASGIAELDRLLGGGFPSGALVTLEGVAGRWSIAAAVLAQATCRGLAAVLDDGALYPPSLAEAGARLDRILVVPAGDGGATARAADLLLRAHACRVVLLSAPDLAPAGWERLAGLAHRSGTLLLAIVPAATPALAFAATVRVHCALAAAGLHGSGALWGMLAGFSVRAELRKHKGRVAGRQVALRSVVTCGDLPLRERVVRTCEARRAALS